MAAFEIKRFIPPAPAFGSIERGLESLSLDEEGHEPQSGAQTSGPSGNYAGAGAYF